MDEEGKEQVDGGERNTEDSQQHTPWNPGSAPHLRWKVFVKGHDSTLQTRGMCEEKIGGDGNPSISGLQGDATRSFYESVVRPANIQTNMDRHEETDTNKQTDINTIRRKVKDRGIHRHQETDRQRGRHRKTDSCRTAQPDTNTSSQRGTHETEPNTHQQGITSTCQDNTNHNTRLMSTYTLPLGTQDTHTALRLAQTNDVAALSTMLDEGLNINTKDGYGWSLLMVAACAGAVDTVRMLLARGARTGFRDARGNTALYLATIKGHHEVTEILIKANKRRTHRMEGEMEGHEEEGQGESGSSEMAEDEEYFCDTCEVVVKEREGTKHKASIIHQFKMKGTQMRTQYGIPPSNRGYQLLVGQGWDTEGGLGSDKQGLKFPVKTVLKRDRKGLGAGGDETPRVTHFGPGDAAAVKRTYDRDRSRVERPATISRREMRRRKTKEQQEEIKLRRMLNEPDY